MFEKRAFCIINMYINLTHTPYYYFISLNSFLIDQSVKYKEVKNAAVTNSYGKAGINRTK
ncbi:hypothetical protein J19TS1_05050 [Heyndrickxia oleronia]|nr:hypothetical protein J19TS1_05050 [Heyndrickxia oleronia]